MIMPWGKHRGKEFTEIPSSYLKWVTENVDPKKTDIIEAASAEYDQREMANCHFEEDRAKPPANKIQEHRCPNCGVMFKD